MTRSGIAIAVIPIAIGIALATTGESICRTSCWIDNLFRLMLPDSLKGMAGGTSWIIGGLLLLALDWRKPKK